MRFSVVRFRSLLAAAFVCMLTAAPGRADFDITGVDENVAAGSTATVTFTISDSAPYQDQLADFQVQLQLSGTLGNSGVLQFSSLSDQPNPYNSSNYVFANNSFDQSPPPSPFWDSVSSSVAGGPLNLATGGDFTADGSGISFSSTASYLLATVQIDATNAVVGDTYQIALVPNDNTYFQDANFNNINYSSTAADITIVAAASAVPAPSSLVLAGIGCLAILLYYGKHRCCAFRSPALPRVAKSFPTRLKLLWRTP